MTTVHYFMFIALGQALLVKPGPEGETTCARLFNEDSYSSVEVSVGEPPQVLRLVADTGSDNCIIKDCGCQSCLEEWGKHCFRDPKESGSFRVPKFNQGHRRSSFADVTIQFGSGDISSRIASGVVGLGNVQTYLENGLLLMRDHTLDIHTHFEGILGLGRPRQQVGELQGQPKGVPMPGLFDQAQVRRFSMCFNHGSDGVLGIHTPKQPESMISVGSMHWAMDFQGLSIGKHKLSFCKPNSKSKQMETACSVIPDSGTTMITGPQDQLMELYETLCMAWPRCVKAHEEMVKSNYLTKHWNASKYFHPESGAAVEKFPFSHWKHVTEIVRLPKGTTTELVEAPGGGAGDALSPAISLQVVLEECASWMGDVDLNEELPQLHFHVAGLHGKTREITLPPKSYVISRDSSMMAEQKAYDPRGMGASLFSQQRRKVCLMAFSPMEFNTAQNGPIWILGTPLFYEYTAHYDRGDGSGKETSMAFVPRSEESCGRCKGTHIEKGEGLLVLEGEESNTLGTGMETLRKLSKPPVIRNLTGWTHL